MGYQIQVIHVGDGFTPYVKSPHGFPSLVSSIWCDTEQQAFDRACRFVDVRVSRLLSH
jgi:hypothetical protein